MRPQPSTSRRPAPRRAAHAPIPTRQFVVHIALLLQASDLRPTFDHASVDVVSGV